MDITQTLPTSVRITLLEYRNGASTHRHVKMLKSKQFMSSSTSLVGCSLLWFCLVIFHFNASFSTMSGVSVRDNHRETRHS